MRIKASAQSFVVSAIGAPEGPHAAPLLTVAQLEQIVRTLAAG